METNQITKQHRKAQKISYRKFADAINESLINTNVNYSTVYRWEAETDHYEPDMQLLFECIATYSDWRAKWAIENVIAMWPDLIDRGVVTFKLPQGE